MKKVLCFLLVLIVIVALLGGAGWYFLFYQADQTADFFLDKGDSAMRYILLYGKILLPFLTKK